MIEQIKGLLALWDTFPCFQVLTELSSIRTGLGMGTMLLYQGCAQFGLPTVSKCECDNQCQSPNEFTSICHIWVLEVLSFEQISNKSESEVTFFFPHCALNYHSKDEVKGLCSRKICCNSITFLQSYILTIQRKSHSPQNIYGASQQNKRWSVPLNNWSSIGVV